MLSDFGRGFDSRRLHHFVLMFTRGKEKEGKNAGALDCSGGLGSIDWVRVR